MESFILEKQMSYTHTDRYTCHIHIQTNDFQAHKSFFPPWSYIFPVIRLCFADQYTIIF